jgi:hypothetical protein
MRSSTPCRSGADAPAARPARSARKRRPRRRTLAALAVLGALAGIGGACTPSTEGPVGTDCVQMGRRGRNVACQ